MSSDGVPPPPGKTFATSFWGENDKAGLEAVEARLKQAKHVSEDIQAMYKERASIEEEFGKRLTKLSKTFNPTEEIGTLRNTVDVVRNELEKSARAHLDLANELRNKLEKPLAELILTQRTIRKQHVSIIEKHIQAKANQLLVVVKHKDKYEQKTMESSQIIQNLPGMPPKEADKAKQRLEKAQSQARQSEVDYQAAVEKLIDTHKKWISDFTVACEEFQKLEEDRFHFTRGSMWNYANYLSTLCVSDDESCERIRQSLELCDFSKDLEFVLERGATGSQIPQALSHVYFIEPAGRKASIDTHAAAAGIAAMSTSDRGETGSNGGGGVGWNSSPMVAVSNENNSRAGSGGGSGPKLASSPITAAGVVASAEDPWKVASTASNPMVGSSMDTSLGAGSAQNLAYNPYDVPDNAPVLCTVTVLYDYASQAPEELSLVKGQTLPVLEMHPDGWWEGIMMENGMKRKGLFPSNFTDGGKA